MRYATRVTAASILTLLSVLPVDTSLAEPQADHAEPAQSWQRGTWTNVTPSGVNLESELDCGNYGSSSIVADPAKPAHLYTLFDCQGVWKSTDFGLTWAGPINTGLGGAGVRGAGGLAIARGPAGQPPVLYAAIIRGAGLGLWASTDGGVNWKYAKVAPGGARQDFYPPVVDPYNPEHLIMSGHEMNLIVRSVDGGRGWTAAHMDPGMHQDGGTGFVFFIDTGDASTTANTWLWTAQGTGGAIGTWRTTDGGKSWTRVDRNEHPHGQMQIYQPDVGGVIFMAGLYSDHGWGILRSADFGQSWSRVGISSNQATVFGTPKNIFAMYAWACGKCAIDPAMQVAPRPGIVGWVAAPTPQAMTMGAARTVTVFDGEDYVIVTANWLSGLWRYVE